MLKAKYNPKKDNQDQQGHGSASGKGGHLVPSGFE